MLKKRNAAVEIASKLVQIQMRLHAEKIGITKADMMQIDREYGALDQAATPEEQAVRCLVLQAAAIIRIYGDR